jgi:hypothetical protein
MILRARPIYHPDDDGSTHLWNVCLLERDNTAIYPRKLPSSAVVLLIISLKDYVIITGSSIIICNIWYSHQSNVTYKEFVALDINFLCSPMKILKYH